MNERIKELALQSMLVTREGDKLVTGWVEYADLTEEIEKFAELIVRDCMAQCQIIANQCEFVVTGEMARRTKATAESCAYMIKLRFGVNE